MDKLALHDATKKLTAAYSNNPAHALILSGLEGSGLGTLAHVLALRIAGHSSAITIIEPEKGTIGIDRIRQLYEKTRSINHDRQVVIIDDGDAMGGDAQNALLKLFEEPVANVHFIVTTHNEERILPTITSRAQSINVRPIDPQQQTSLLNSFDLDETRRKQILFLASGRPAEIHRLATQDSYFEESVRFITDAREFLQTSSYERLMSVKKYSDRDAALRLIATALQLLRFSIVKQKQVSSIELTQHFEASYNRIKANGHVKTHLMHLVTKLG